MSALKLGFIPLACCAPLAVAKARGFFEDEGLDVTLSREPSWANVRDKVAAGLLDGAHMLGPLPLAMTLGLGIEPTPVITPMALNLNGSAITVSNAVAEAMRDIDPDAMAVRPRTAAPLKTLVERRRQAGQPPLTFAAVFPYSVHNYELRHWLAAGGVDPHRDVRIVIVPPPRMVEQLSAGAIDGFCVTAPWNAMAWQAGVGEALVHASEIWTRSPDKMFGVTEGWAERHSGELRALVRAMVKAAAWADAPENRADLADLLADPSLVGAPQAALRLSLAGDGVAAGAFEDPNYIVFHQDDANRPAVQQAEWFLGHMARWGQIPAGTDVSAIARRVYRPDLYEAALRA